MELCISVSVEGIRSSHLMQLRDRGLHMCLRTFIHILLESIFPHAVRTSKDRPPSCSVLSEARVRPDTTFSHRLVHMKPNLLFVIWL